MEDLLHGESQSIPKLAKLVFFSDLCSLSRQIVSFIDLYLFTIIIYVE